MPTYSAQPTRPIRCAIYTRRSVGVEADDEQNSVRLQRQICSAYVRSQRHRGWAELPQHYDDAGHTGANLERPALRQLCRDVEEGLVDTVVIYKLDRLTRSLGDFIRLIDQFEQYNVAFVSVTQAFDTQDTMGRLVLNILLTFAQFEREMLADRVRDKAAAMKRAGRWSGGAPPFGYDIVNRKLVANEAEAPVVRSIFERFLELGSANKVTVELRAQGQSAKRWINRHGAVSGGGLVTTGMIYALLGNPVYIGEFHVDGQVHRGLHEPILDRALWEQAQALRTTRRRRATQPKNTHVLLDHLYDEVGRRMCIESGRTKGAKYSYYISQSCHPLTRRGMKQLRARASELDQLVLTGISSFLRRPFELSGAIHSLGLRDNKTDQIVAAGSLAARRLESFDGRRLRLAWDAIIDRIELSRVRVRIILRCDQIAALLAWPGTGLFRDRKVKDSVHHAVHVLEFEACPVRTERSFRLPIQACADASAKPKKPLVSLMRMARAFQEYIFEHRHLSIDEAAVHHRRRGGFFSRVLRLNYLAPDIIAAIMDGTQPPELTRQALLFSHVPSDWAQQRALLGFPARSDPTPSDAHY
jgi:site-specific DNA recombinase